MWLSLVLLLVVAKNSNLKQAFVRGYLWGFIAFLVGVSWVYNSMHDYGGASVFAAAAFSLVLIAYLALFPAVCLAFWSRLFMRRAKWLQIIGFALLFSVAQWVQAWFLTGFPWLMVGYAATDSFFAAFLPVLGVLGVGFIIALCAAIIAVWQWQLKFALSASLFFLTLFITSYFLDSWQRQLPNNKSVQVALVQGNIPQNIKIMPQYRYVSLETYEKLSRMAYNKADIVIWPETAIPDFAHNVMPFISQVEESVKGKRATVFTGVFIQSATDKNAYYNSMLEIGNSKQHYHKHRLVPFGEYMPLRQLLGFFAKFVQIPMADMNPGPLLRQPITLQGVKVSPSICYEMAYSDVLAASIIGSEMMLNTSNDAWFGDSLAPHQHLEMARARSRVFHKPMARATNTGISATIDALGNIKKTIAPFSMGVLYDEISLNQHVMPFAKIGQKAVGIVLFLSLLLFIAIGRVHKE